MGSKPAIPSALIADWQKIVDLTADLVDVPSCLVMRTDPPSHSVLVSSQTADNPYQVGVTFELNSKLYCFSVLQKRNELLVRDALAQAEWSDNQDLEHGMSFYIGYPLIWPDGALFGTICVLDRHENQRAILYRDLLLEFCRLIERDLALLTEVAERQRLEIELQNSLHLLEDRVADRTSELNQVNLGLHQEIANRKRAEEVLLQREKQLEEANTALRVLLAQVESSRLAFEDKILQQIKGLVLPHLSKLRHDHSLSNSAIAYLDLLETNLQSITSSFAQKLTTISDRLTPTEAEIAQMIMAGKSTKEIAQVLSRETSTIDFHRNNIRKKLRIDNRLNLRSHLRSLQ